MMSKILEDSVAETQRLLESVLGQQSYLDATTLPLLLRKPPFSLLHGIISDIARVTGFAASLVLPQESCRVDFRRPQEQSSPPASCCATPSIARNNGTLLCSKADKIRFLIRSIACVAFADPKRYGPLFVLVVPSRMLAGKDVPTTHRLLQALLSVASNTPSERLLMAEKKVQHLGDLHLYARSLRHRAAIKTFQRHIRTFLQTRQIGRDYQPKEIITTEKTTNQPVKSCRLADLHMRIVNSQVRQTTFSLSTARHFATQSIAGSSVGPQPVKQQPTVLKKPTSKCDLRSPFSEEKNEDDEVETLRKKLTNAERQLEKQKAIVQRVLRARRRAERQAEMLLAGKKLMEEDLKRASESHSKLARYLKNIAELRKKIQEQVPEAKQEKGQLIQFDDTAASSASNPSQMQDLERLKMIRCDLEKRETRLLQLQQKLKKKEVETSQLKKREMELQQKEERIQELAERLRNQRTKLYLTLRSKRQRRQDQQIKGKILQQQRAKQQEQRLVKTPFPSGCIYEFSSHQISCLRPRSTPFDMCTFSPLEQCSRPSSRLDVDEGGLDEEIEIDKGESKFLQKDASREDDNLNINANGLLIKEDQDANGRPTDKRRIRESMPDRTEDTPPSQETCVLTTTRAPGIPDVMPFLRTRLFPHLQDTKATPDCRPVTITQPSNLDGHETHQDLPCSKPHPLADYENPAERNLTQSVPSACPSVLPFSGKAILQTPLQTNKGLKNDNKKNRAFRGNDLQWLDRFDGQLENSLQKLHKSK